MDSNSDITSALETAKSGANLASDRKIGFSQNLGYALADFYGHYSLQDLRVNKHVTTQPSWVYAISSFKWQKPLPMGWEVILRVISDPLVEVLILI